MFFAWRRTALHRNVVVNLPDKAFSGVLFAKRGPLLVLRNAELHLSGAQPQPMDGDVVIERLKVEFIQVVPERAS